MCKPTKEGKGTNKILELQAASSQETSGSQTSSTKRRSFLVLKVSLSENYLTVSQQSVLHIASVRNKLSSNIREYVNFKSSELTKLQYGERIL